MTGLAGPLHGLANQEVLRWLTDVRPGKGIALLSLVALSAEGPLHSRAPCT